MTLRLYPAFPHRCPGKHCAVCFWLYCNGKITSVQYHTRRFGRRVDGAQ